MLVLDRVLEDSVGRGGAHEEADVETRPEALGVLSAIWARLGVTF